MKKKIILLAFFGLACVLGILRVQANALPSLFSEPASGSTIHSGDTIIFTPQGQNTVLANLTYASDNCKSSGNVMVIGNIPYACGEKYPVIFNLSAPLKLVIYKNTKNFQLISFIFSVIHENGEEVNLSPINMNIAGLDISSDNQSGLLIATPNVGQIIPSGGRAFFNLSGASGTEFAAFSYTNKDCINPAIPVLIGDDGSSYLCGVQYSVSLGPLYLAATNVNNSRESLAFRFTSYKFVNLNYIESSPIYEYVSVSGQTQLPIFEFVSLKSLSFRLGGAPPVLKFGYANRVSRYEIEVLRNDLTYDSGIINLGNASSSTILTQNYFPASGDYTVNARACNVSGCSGFVSAGIVALPPAPEVSNPTTSAPLSLATSSAPQVVSNGTSTAPVATTTNATSTAGNSTVSRTAPKIPSANSVLGKVQLQREITRLRALLVSLLEQLVEMLTAELKVSR